MSDLRAIYTLWLRDVTRYTRHKPRLIASFFTPLILLFFLGHGISATFGARMGAFSGKIEYIEFIFSGILAMNILFVSIFFAMNIVWDREFGFLKEVLVAPVSRWAVVVGRVAGGSTVAAMQATVFLGLAPIVGVELSLKSGLLAFGEIWFLAFSFTSLGVMVAARVQSMENFQFARSFLTMPMFFLSGALYDISRFPAVMGIIARLNPFSYGVDLLRGTISGISVNPIAMNVGLLGLFAAITFTLAVYSFERHH